MHHMTFWWGPQIDGLVVSGIHTEDAWGLTLLCVGLVAFCLLYEALKFHQAKIRLATHRERFRMIACQPPNESATLLTGAELAQQRLQHAVAAAAHQQAQAGPSSSGQAAMPQPTPRIMFVDPAPGQRCLQLAKEALIFLIQALLGYFLMLAVMSYNGPVVIAIVLGMTLGYFLFGHLTMDLNWQSQRMNHTTFKCSTNCPEGESVPPATSLSASAHDTINSGSPAPAFAENQAIQSLSAATNALRKLQDVAEGIVDNHDVAINGGGEACHSNSRDPTNDKTSHSCCNKA